MTKILNQATATKQAPKAPASAKPGTSDVAAQKPEKAKKAKRQHHPLLAAKANDKGRLVPSVQLKEIPKDYDPKLHLPLGRKSFEDESLWYEIKAQELERKAAAMREEGKQIKAIGGSKDRAAAKKLIALQKRIADLTAELSGKGVDVSAITAKLQADLAAKTAKPEAAPAA